MTVYAQPLNENTVRFERVLPAPIEKVWDYIVDSDKRAKWLASGDMEQRPNGKVTLVFRNTELPSVKEPAPDKHKGKEGSGFTATVLECDKPRLLRMTWGVASEVTFELSPQGKDTKLVLTHRKLPGRSDKVNVSGGWHTHLAILQEVLAGEPVGPFWSRFEKLHAEYEQRIN